MDQETEEVFRQEAESLIESLQAGLLDLKRDPENMEVVSQVFRDLHTIKGTGAMFGFQRLADFVHDFEAAFEGVRSGTTSITDDLIDVSLKAYDLIVSLLEGDAPDPQVDADLKRALKAATGAEVAMPNSEEPAPTVSGAPLGAPWLLKISLPDDLIEIGGNPVALINELIELGNNDVSVKARVGETSPVFSEMNPSKIYLAWEIELPAETGEQDIRDVFMFHEGRMTLDLMRVPESVDAARTDAVAPAAPFVAAPAATPADNAQKPQSAGPDKKRGATAGRTKGQMRVPSERLDDIMDRVGELVIAESRLATLSSKIDSLELREMVETIKRLALGLRHTTMAIRLSPLSSITGKFHRLAHDLSGKTGKKFDLIIEGEDTELDKSVIDALTDPLVHILRNAVDHGLESNADRVAAGKPERGTVTLSARHSGADVLISVTDDGKGLNPDFIKERAVARGLVEPGATLSRNEIFALLLEPGFSTAETVTDLSGRGVGTDVVKNTVEGLRGSIYIDSELGRGATFTLRLPLTLAIIEGLMIQVGTERYTVPLSAVEGIVELPEKLEAVTEMCSVVELDDNLVSILRLRKAFGVPGDAPRHSKIVLVRANDEQVGLVADRIIGSFQTVIKQLSPLHTRLNVFSGATILGDGTVALIVDVAQIVRSQNIENSQKRRVA